MQQVTASESTLQPPRDYNGLSCDIARILRAQVGHSSCHVLRPAQTLDQCGILLCLLKLWVLHQSSCKFCGYDACTKGLAACWMLGMTHAQASRVVSLRPAGKGKTATTWLDPCLQAVAIALQV